MDPIVLRRNGDRVQKIRIMEERKAKVSSPSVKPKAKPKRK